VGHVFSKSATMVRRGHFCARCRGRPRGDLGRIQRIARGHKGTCLSTELVNMKTKLQFRCRDGHTWWACPAAIVQGTWCPVCARSRSTTRRLTLGDLQLTAATNGGRCLATTFENGFSRVDWECNLGHRWTARVQGVQGGTWCPTCARRGPGTIDGMHALAARMGGRCLSTEYNGHGTLLTFECGAGHRFTTTGAAVKGGVWCVDCAGVA
jgi:hypothetical protein